LGSRRPLEPGHQRGQAILWFLATAAACCAVFTLVYNVGQVTNEKEKTVNAADASAISGALTEARILNFEAYTNRALIANEVSIAQLVSLDSWIKYNYEITLWLDTYFGEVPIVGEVLAALRGGMQGVSKAVYAAVSAAIPGIEFMNTALEGARDLQDAAGAAAAYGIASGVAKANQTTFGNRYDEQPEMVSAAVLAINELAWKDFTDPYARDKRADAKKVILNSRDPFSTHRGNGWLLGFINTFTSWASAGGWAFPYLSIDKTSGSSDLKDYRDWEAQDSADLTFHHLGYCGTAPFGYPCIESNAVPLPFGYGRADADNDSSTGNNLCWVSPSTANCDLAMQNSDKFSWRGPYYQLSGDTGLPDIRDLTKRVQDDCSEAHGSDGPSVTFVSAVQKKGAATMTTPRLNMDVDTPGPLGSVQVKDNLQNGDKLTSIATACAFFLRPDFNQNDRTQGHLLARTDHVHEFASLYNPYWQARLAKTNLETKGELYLLIGQNPFVAPWTP